MNEATGTADTPKATSVPIKSDQRSDSTRNGLLCAFIVAACVLITNPAADMPFSDGFSYSKTALDFTRTGHVLYNGWATAMLGWLIPWGALFIKIFGFSFTVMRLTMLPIVVATVYLFHQILRRFGINSNNAVFGTLALALSPIFLPSAVSFMTDMPGLFVIFICIYMCQRAVAAANERVSLLWLCSAMVINVAGGTVRQIAWLGALVMVPSTVWLLRERRGMKVAGVLLLLLSLAGVLTCLHWFNEQPYSVPEHVIWGPVRMRMLIHLAAQLLKTFLCFLLVIFPVSVAWLPAARRLNRNARLRFAAAISLLALFAIILNATGGMIRIDGWVMPWLMYLLAEQSSSMPGVLGMTPATVNIWIRIVISLLVIAPALICAELMVAQRRKKLSDFDRHAASWKELGLILGPFSLSYVILLMPRGAFDVIQDRYLVELVPIAIIVLFKLFQERSTEKLPAINMVALTVFAVYSIAGTHDFFAESRAQVSAIQMVETSGVPRRFIQAGFPSDGWIQIQDGGHINEPRIRVPAGAYNAKTPNLNNIPDGCRDGFTKFAPIITPKYFIFFPWFKNPLELPPPWCFARAKYPPVHYRTWLPPFHQELYVRQLRNSSN